MSALPAIVGHELPEPAVHPTRSRAPSFWGRVAVGPSDECWPWLGALTNWGYGRPTFAGRAVYAHRLAYELVVGSVPEGLVLDHLCRNPCCCNPAHLEPVTERENILRGQGAPALNAAKTHCGRGHPLPTTGRPRRCPVCRTESHRREYERRVARRKGAA